MGKRRRGQLLGYVISKTSGINRISILFGETFRHLRLSSRQTGAQSMNLTQASRFDLMPPEFEDGEGSLSEQVHDASWGCLEGTLSENGEVSLSLDAKLIGNRSYSFNHPVDSLAGTEFKISYIPLDTKEHYRDSQTLSLGRAREISEDQSGVRVYKGGFRVFSYGGPDDDWLGIDERRTLNKDRKPDDRFEELSDTLEFHTEFENTLLSLPNNRNLIGRVMISSSAELKMASIVRISSTMT